MLLLGKPVAEKIETEETSPNLKDQTLPHLAIVLVGKNHQSEIYVREKQNAGRVLGVNVSVYCFAETDSLTKIKEAISYLNKDPEIDGIIIQLPLPKKLADKTKTLLNLISPQKDVDGLVYRDIQFSLPSLPSSPSLSSKYIALKKDFFAAKKFLPPTASAVMEVLSFYQIEPKNIALIGRGLLVGKPLAAFFDLLAIKYQVIHSQTTSEEKTKILKKADLVISGTSSKEPIFSAQDLKSKVTVIDCAADFDHNSIKGNWQGLVTPLIGGIGPVTVACLMRNVTLAKQWTNKFKN